MAELQVGIRADVKDAKRVVKSLKDIKKAAGNAGVSMAGAAKTAKSASVSYQLAGGSALKLAGATDLTAAANVALTGTLQASSAAATKLATTESLATRATTVLTGAMTRLRTTMAGMFVKPAAGLKRFATQARTAAGSVIGASTAAAGLGAVVAVGLGVGIKSAVEFELTLSRIEGLVGVAASEVEKFKKPLLEIGKATAKGPNELAEALFFITSAGFKGKQALDVLEASAKAAAAGLGETKQVADAVTSAVNAYGIENLSAARSTDILVATVREGKAEADSIAGALGQVLPAASELGVKFEELGGTIAALTRIGLGADQGATALGATLAAIQKPGNDAKKALKEFGLSASGLRKTVREQGLLPALQQMKEAFGDNETALTRVVPNIRALRAVLPLVGKNAGDVADIFARVADSTNATDDAFEAYRKTTSFTLKEALVALQVSLQKIGDSLLPAVAKAFVTLASAVEKTVNLFEGLGEAVAEAISGPDDPYIRALNNQKELNDAVKDYEQGLKSIVGFDDQGKPIYERLGAATSGFDKAAFAFSRSLSSVAGVELDGSFDEQLSALKKAKKAADTLVQQLEKEKKPIVAAKDAVVELEDAIDDVTDSTPVRVIDDKLLEEGKASLTKLRSEVDFLQSDLTHLQELGQEGMGLAEDAKITADILHALQGETGETYASIRALVNQKRELAGAIDDINEAFHRQQLATTFLDDLVADTAKVKEQFMAIRAGGSLFDIASLQQARDIFNDLSPDDQQNTTVDQIQRQIQAQEVLNQALKAIPVDKMDALRNSISFLEEQRGLAKTEEELRMINAQISALGGSAIDQVFADLGIAEIPFDSIEEQFAAGRKRIEEAFSLAGIVDPEDDPRFQAALERLQSKLSGVSDIMSTFGEAAAQNLQSSFSDILFDPFEAGLDGMAKSFGDMMRRLASDLLANMILMKFLESLSGFGGGVGSIANAGISALGGGGQGGFAEGGTFVGGKPMIVGEKGPEVITPQKGGSVIPNDMLGGQAPAPEVNVGGPTIINTIEDNQIVAAFNRGGGGEVVLNDMTERKTAYRNALGL